MNESKGPNLTNNGIHLNRYGYWAISTVFFDQLIEGRERSGHQPWQLNVDAKSLEAMGRGVTISELKSNGSTLSFAVTETSAPSLPPPTDQPLPPQLEFRRDTLHVQNLAPGTYQLTVDNTPVVTATATVWAKGVAIDTSPAHLEAEAYRAAIHDKNLQFTYSWKALNQVHIVGERKSSASGKALPQEVIEFNRLANQRDAALKDGLQLQKRQWRLALEKN